MSNQHDPAIGKTSLEDLQLSMKAYGFLRRTQIHTVADLMEYTEADLLNLDRESAEEVIQALQQKLGLSLLQE